MRNASQLDPCFVVVYPMKRRWRNLRSRNRFTIECQSLLRALNRAVEDRVIHFEMIEITEENRPGEQPIERKSCIFAATSDVIERLVSNRVVIRACCDGSTVVGNAVVRVAGPIRIH